MKKSLLALILSLSSITLPSLRAQEVEFGLMGGFSIYSGDLAYSEFGIFFDQLNPAFGGLVRFNLNKLVNVRLNVNFGKLTGNDEARGEASRDLNFRSNFSEVTVSGELNFVHADLSPSLTFVPHLILGVGIFRFNPEGNQTGEWVPLQPLGTEGQGLDGYQKPYGLTNINLPIGVGLKFIFNEKITLGFELSGRKLFTDYLDDVSDTQVVYRDVLEGNGPVAALFSNPRVDPNNANPDLTYQRGGSFFDWYYVGGLTLSYRFDSEGGGRRSSETGCYKF